MNPSINYVPSLLFYGGKAEDSIEVKLNRKILEKISKDQIEKTHSQTFPKHDFPMFWQHTNGDKDNHIPYTNLKEVKEVVELIIFLQSIGIENSMIGVIRFYKNQIHQNSKTIKNRRKSRLA